MASHNLFDLCYAMLLREREGVKDYVEFEMLEGMANHQARVIRESADGLLLYAPVVLKEDFHSAIAYLVRRLDENTSEENFLHDLFGMAPGLPYLGHPEKAVPESLPGEGQRQVRSQPHAEPRHGSRGAPPITGTPLPTSVTRTGPCGRIPNGPTA